VRACAPWRLQVRLDLQRAAELGLLVLHGFRHAEWVAPSLAARHARQRPYGRHVPIGRLFSGNPTQMQWMKEVFGDVATLFHFLLTDVRVKVICSPHCQLPAVCATRMYINGLPAAYCMM
jgi:hypothetical protein